MDILVAFAADRVAGYQLALQHSLSDRSIPWLCHPIRPFSWRAKVLWELELARSRPETRIVFVDAWDMVFVGTRDELEALLLSYEDIVVLPSDLACWPHPQKASTYQALGFIQSPWRYVNGSGPAGLGMRIAAVIEELWPRLGIREEHSFHQWNGDGDQRFWTDVYLSGACVLDSECRLTTTLHRSEPSDVAIENGRLTNLRTGARSLFVHANARVRMPDELWPNNGKIAWTVAEPIREK